MKRLAIGILAAGLACSAAEFPMQQQNPKSTNSPENQDVPHQTPGSNNPDLQPEHKPAPKPRQKSTTPEDVPHQGPGTNDPISAASKSRSRKITENIARDPPPLPQRRLRKRIP